VLGPLLRAITITIAMTIAMTNTTTVTVPMTMAMLIVGSLEPEKLVLLRILHIFPITL